MSTGRIQYLNGLGLVASGKRNIASGREYDKYFPAPLRTDPYLSYAGTTTDTIGFMADIIKNTLSDTKKIAPVLRAGSLNATLKNIFDFVFGHIQYKPDDPTTEELRRPARTWADRQSGVDCDCYSIFIGSILSNLNIPFALRMVKIGGKPYFQHVYVVVPKNGKQSGLKNRNDYIVIDPVLDTYNEEHPFTEKYDLFMQPIKYLNGVASLNGLSGGNPLQQPVYFSPEAANTPQKDVIFFDGVDYYTRDTQLAGLGSIDGLNGLGFLRKLIPFGKKIFSKIKKSKFIKKISKPLIYKKDGTKRKLFKKIEQKRNARILRKRQQDLAELNPVSSKKVVSITQDGQAVSEYTNPDLTNQVTETVKDVKKNLKNSIKSILANNKLFKELLETKIEANKGISADEAREIAKQTAAAERASIQNDILENIDRMKNAGFGSGLNMQNVLLGITGVGLLFSFINKNRVQTI